MKPLYKLLFTCSLATLLGSAIYAQSPQKFGYQAVIRKPSGDLVVNQAVATRIAILQGSSSGTVVYEEIQNTQTNTNGLLTFEIGNGTIVTGDLSSIDWSTGPYFIKTETDPNGGTNYTIQTNMQLLSVPYALHAQTAIHTLNDADGQLLSITGQDISISNGNTVTLPGTANPVGAAGGDLSGTYPNPTIGNNAVTTAKINTASVTADKLHQMGASNGQVLKYNGTSWTPATDNTGGIPSGNAGGDLTGTYPNPSIAGNAVTTAKINNAAITTDKLANSAVTGAKLHDMGATNGQVLKYNGTAWIPAADDNTIGWSLSGNTVTATSFIGTTNTQPLRFKMNNQLAGMITLNNTGWGYQSLNSITTGEYNTAIGAEALKSMTTGGSNIAIGRSSMNASISGSSNIAIGQFSLTNNTGNNNIGIGFNTLETSTGGSNMAIGNAALKVNTTGSTNLALGMGSLYENTSGSSNTAVGSSALYYNETGSDNASIGRSTLTGNISGNYNTAIGHYANVGGANYSNATVVGYNSLVNASNRVRIGNTAVTQIAGQVNWTAASDGRIKADVQENVPGLTFIAKLRPVTYRFNSRAQNEILGIKGADEAYPGKYDIDAITQTGFIAQEVEQAAKQSGFDFSGVSRPANEKDIYGLRYADFVVPIVKAVQEQQQMIEELQEQNKKWQQDYKALQQQLQTLQDQQ